MPEQVPAITRELKHVHVIFRLQYLGRICTCAVSCFPLGLLHFKNMMRVFPCHLSFLRNGNVAFVCRLFMTMLRVDFKI